MSVPDSPAGLEALRGRGMPERSAVDRARVPWDVQFVGPGPDADAFAYTRGLWRTFGHPELYAPVSPAAGAEDDPDWRLSLHDVAGVLNEACERVRGGEHLAAGHTWDMPVDAGRTTLHWGVSDAPPDWPSAHQVAPDAPVLQLSYVLQRQPAGQYAPPSAEEAERLRPRTEPLLERAFGELRSLQVTPDSPRGPFAEVVDALLALTRGATDDVLWEVAATAHFAAARQQGAAGAVVEEMRLSGRQQFFAQLENAVGEVVDEVLARPELIDNDEDGQGLGTGLVNALIGAAAAWTVADVIDEGLLDLAAGLATGLLADTGRDDEQARARVDALNERLRSATPKEVRRLMRAMEPDAYRRAHRRGMFVHHALTLGFAPLWRRVPAELPELLSEEDEASLYELYDSVVASLLIGESAPVEDRNAVANPFRAGLKFDP